MSEPLRLVVFDVDGTLVNSRSHIVVSLQELFSEYDLAHMSDTAFLRGVGLSLPEMIALLAPEVSKSTQEEMVVRYKEMSFARHVSAGSVAESPFYPGIRTILDALRQDDFTLMAAATGNSRRGLNRIVDHHGLEGYFQSMQVADNHPSKPHPSMIQTALSETGVDAKNAIMIGDTSFDMEMGKSAGVNTVGVTWGYHSPTQMAEADVLVDDADALATHITSWIESLT